MKKELVEHYIKTKSLVDKKTSNFSDVLATINEDNYIVGLIPYEYENMVDALATELFGLNGFDWICWWLYDANQAPSKIWINDVEIAINNFEDLWDNVLVHE